MGRKAILVMATGLTLCFWHGWLQEVCTLLQPTNVQCCWLQSLTWTWVANFIDLTLPWLYQNWFYNNNSITVKKQMLQNRVKWQWRCRCRQNGCMCHGLNLILLTGLLTGFWLYLILSQHHGNGLISGYYVTCYFTLKAEITFDFNWLNQRWIAKDWTWENMT